MFPEVLDDYVGENNTVRFIDAYMDGLDLAAMGFTFSESKERGRKPHNPGDKAIHLWIFAQNQIEPAIGKGHTREHRNDLVEAAVAARFQDHSRFSQG